jgi:16S rRNA (uracil1498-N3)-methyltransferase
MLADWRCLRPGKADFAAAARCDRRALRHTSAMTVRLYVDAPLQRDAEIDLPAAAARHVQVRRLQPGDLLRLFNGQGGEWHATVMHMGRSHVAVRVSDFEPIDCESALRVTVALGMPANERMDFLVEKATELGVDAIQPLQCERSVLRLAGDRAVRKREHWQGIAAAAAEQCGRTRVPQVAAVQTLERFLAQPPDAALRLLLSPAAGTPPLHAVAADARELLTLSGPEGGLSPAEEQAALAHGFQRARLGDRVLRAETAPLAVLAWAGLKDA